MPIVMSGLPVILLLLWLGKIVSPTDLAEIESASTIFSQVKDLFTQVWQEQVFAIAIIVVSAILLNQIINAEDFFDRQTFIPSYAYVLMMSVFSEYQMLHPIILSNFFVILALRRLFQIKRSDDARRMMFDAGIFLGIAAIFYQYYLGFYLLAWLTLAVLRPFVWREHALGFLGLMVPFLFFLFYQFMSNDLDGFYTFFEPSKQYTESFISTNVVKRGVGIGVALLMCLVSARIFLKRQRSSSMRFKRISNIVLFLGMIVLLLTAMHILLRFEAPTVFISVIFGSFLVTFYFFYANRKKLASIVFYLVTVLVVVNIYYDFVHKILV